MVGSVDAMDDANGEKSLSLSSVSCSICLDFVVPDNGERSIAKLQCGHEFHLDCIGSAFNTKGAMQCPNCRKIEGGRWLYANGSARSLSDFGMDDWTFREDPSELSYSEMPFGVHWCPFSGLTGVHSSFEFSNCAFVYKKQELFQYFTSATHAHIGEVESPSTTYHDLQGNHAIFAEHIAASSLAHSHVAYVRSVPRAPSNLSESVDDPNSSHRRNGQHGQNEIYNPHAFPALNVQYRSWGHHSPPFFANRSHINGSDQASVPPTTLRSSRVETDAMTRSGPFVLPFLYGHGSVPRGASSFVSSIVHPGSNTWSHEWIQVSHASRHPQQPSNPLLSSILPGVGRFNGGPRGLPLIMPALPQSDRHGGFYIFPPSGSSGQNPHEAENSLQWERDHLSRFPVISFDRDSGWGSSQHASGGIDSSNRSGNFWQRHWS